MLHNFCLYLGTIYVISLASRQLEVDMTKRLCHLIADVLKTKVTFVCPNHKHQNYQISPKQDTHTSTSHPPGLSDQDHVTSFHLAKPFKVCIMLSFNYHVTSSGGEAFQKSPVRTTGSDVIPYERWVNKLANKIVSVRFTDLWEFESSQMSPCAETRLLEDCDKMSSSDDNVTVINKIFSKPTTSRLNSPSVLNTIPNCDTTFNCSRKFDLPEDLYKLYTFLRSRLGKKSQHLNEADLQRSDHWHILHELFERAAQNQPCLNLQSPYFEDQYSEVYTIPIETCEDSNRFPTAPSTQRVSAMPSSSSFHAVPSAIRFTQVPTINTFSPVRLSPVPSEGTFSNVTAFEEEIMGHIMCGDVDVFRQTGNAISADVLPHSNLVFNQATSGRYCGHDMFIENNFHRTYIIPPRPC